MASFDIRGVLETCLYASDLDQSEDFYTRVLKLKLFIKNPERHLFYRCGDSMLMLFNPDETRNKQSVVNGSSVPSHGAIGPGHAAFKVRLSEMDQWRDWLIRHDVEIESEVDWPSGGHSIYFRDPTNNCLELASPGIWNLAE